ncbi:MAG: hypothetical protein HC932_00900 [Thermales bacterium]|nr:hypothetical protein [Thermales bacterium]
MRAIQSAVIGYVLILLAWGVGGGGDGVIITFVQDTLTGTTGSEINADPTRQLILSITNFLTGLAAIVAVLVIIWGGYKFFFSTLPGSKEDGKQTILNGVTGLIVILLAGPLIGIVSDTFSQQTDQLELNTGSIIKTFVEIINNFLIPISAVVTVFFLVWAGYDYIFSRGDSSKVQSARTKLNNALIGLIIVLLAVTISQLIVFFVGNLNLTA